MSGGVVLLAAVLGIAALLHTQLSGGEPASSSSTTKQTGHSPLGCKIVPVPGYDDVTQVVPPDCSDTELAERFCNARGPFTTLGVTLAGPQGSGITTIGYRDGSGRGFGVLVTPGRGEPALKTLSCSEGRQLPITKDEVSVLNKEGDTLPASLEAKIASGGTPAVPARPTLDRAQDGVARTPVGDGDPEACVSELSRLLREVVFGITTQDGAEAQIPDASGTVAFRNAVEAVPRLQGDGLGREEAITEARSAFTYVCGAR